MILRNWRSGAGTHVAVLPALHVFWRVALQTPIIVSIGFVDDSIFKSCR